ncbi:MAG TPA: DUF6163 family protein [Xanthobacteraceae bacterium]|nr:DUF6163 family protein [Xanthobacteraceae bacterium]
MTSLDPGQTRMQDPDDPLDAAIGPDSVEIKPWQARLVLFQRIAGGFMIAKGLIHWAVLFTGAAFYALPVEARAATVFFAVIDLVAGVSLWLGSTWGASVWLFAVASQAVAGLLFVRLTGLMIMLTIFEIMLVAFYVVVRFMAYREQQD